MLVSLAGSTLRFELCTDGHVGVIQDAKFKRREALSELAKVASKK